VTASFVAHHAILFALITVGDFVVEFSVLVYPRGVLSAG
jgi:hypothetical protein